VRATSSRSPPGTRGSGSSTWGMSFGLPAIASRAGGGAIETVADGETGVLVDPDDPVAVARALDEFATDPDRLAAMGRAARRRYERHPSWAESTARSGGCSLMSPTRPTPSSRRWRRDGRRQSQHRRRDHRLPALPPGEAHGRRSGARPAARRTLSRATRRPRRSGRPRDRFASSKPGLASAR